ncbi:heparinase II/III family protein [Glycocaulis abyssi]|uniref:Heparinase II/III family protein n=1 Tax=Glycocaulis abyssi TaxID=1433403 RepID=A0ABV9NG46_9PROT
MISGRFLRTVQHTPIRQLMHRASLMAKRRTLSTLASRFPAIKRPPNRAVPPLANDLPTPFLVGAHGKVSVTDGRYTFDLLNAPRQFTLPVDWHHAELNTGTRLWKLNLHYFDYAHHLGDADFAALVTDWIEQNRPFTPQYWMDSWNSYAMSIRLVAWMAEYQRRQGRLDSAFAARLTASIAEQARFLLANLEEDIGGNHLIKNIRALYWCGRFFDGALSRKATQTAGKLLARELDRQILPDGFHFELSPAYHCQVLADLLDCYRLMPASALRTRLETTLGKMAQAAADVIHPDGFVSLFNDGGLHMTVSYGALKDAFETVLGRWPDTQASGQYRDAGYHVMRTPDIFLIYDAGRLGPDGLPAHAQGDVFSYELTLGPQRMIVDTGVFEYNAGPRRAHSRATTAHNTLTLDDEDQGEFWSAFRLGRRPQVTVHAATTIDDTLMVDARHDGYAKLGGSPIHRRMISAGRNGVINVCDEITGGKGQRAVSRLLLHPDVEIIEEDDNHFLLRAGRAALRLDARTAQVSIQDAPWWPDFGCEITTRQLVLDYGTAPGKWHYQLRLEAAPRRASA